MKVLKRLLEFGTFLKVNSIRERDSIDLALDICGSNLLDCNKELQTCRKTKGWLKTSRDQHERKGKTIERKMKNIGKRLIEWRKEIKQASDGVGFKDPRPQLNEIKDEITEVLKLLDEETKKMIEEIEEMEAKQESLFIRKSGEFTHLTDLYSILSLMKAEKPESQARNFMRVRILEPDPEEWYSIKKKAKSYYIVKEKTLNSSKFITLDIGDLEEAGIQGLAFIRGVPKSLNLPIGHKITTRNWRSQAMRIEFKKINSSPEESPKKQISKAMKRYEKDITNFLKYEYQTEIKEIKIVPKEKDFQLEITKNWKKKSPPLTKIANIIKECRHTIEEEKVICVKKGDNLYLGRDVEDKDEKGYSNIIEIENTLEEIDADLFIIDRKTLNARLMRLALIIKKSKKGDLKNKANKKKALELINDYRKDYDFNPIDIDIYLNNIKPKSKD